VCAISILQLVWLPKKISDDVTCKQAYPIYLDESLTQLCRGHCHNSNLRNVSLLPVFPSTINLSCYSIIVHLSLITANMPRINPVLAVLQIGQIGTQVSNSADYSHQINSSPKRKFFNVKKTAVSFSSQEPEYTNRSSSS
jgi:hypothetical protein